MFMKLEVECEGEDSEAVGRTGTGRRKGGARSWAQPVRFPHSPNNVLLFILDASA